MSKYKVDSTSLTAVADAIRAKTGKSASMEFPTEFVSEIGSISGGGTGYYNIASGDIYALFDQYATENGMTKIDVTIPTDGTSNTTIQHNLGYVPTEALLYPKNPTIDTTHYQIGWVKGLFAQDKMGNRTYNINISGFAPSQEASIPIQYHTGKTLPALLSSIVRTDYNFTQEQPTSTTITIRGGTTSPTKLLAGEYVLALK